MRQRVLTRSSDRFWKAAAIHPYTPKPATASGSGTQIPFEPPPFTYIWFGGTPGEDVQSFVHSVQRTAGSQNRQADDAWIMQYVEKGLSGDALLWFSGLEGEAKRTWVRLREALIQRFPPPAQTDRMDQNQLSPANPFGTLLLSPKSAKAATIQVIDTSDQASLGYLCKNLTFAVGPSFDDALLVECPQKPSTASQEPTYLRIMNLEPQSCPAFLGLTGGGTDEEPKPWLLTPCSSGIPLGLHRALNMLDLVLPYSFSSDFFSRPISNTTPSKRNASLASSDRWGASPNVAKR
ncbi:hypothetical protein FRC00_007429 [Tulasnella sp. 408]|nr:hypothetical protein FRC00_007429 [Tulasnella sp. 408]